MKDIRKMGSGVRVPSLMVNGKRNVLKGKAQCEPQVLCAVPAWVISQN